MNASHIAFALLILNVVVRLLARWGPAQRPRLLPTPFGPFLPPRRRTPQKRNRNL